MSTSPPNPLDHLHANAPDGFRIPPPVFEEMEGEVVDYAEGERLRVRFPVRERYENPAGMMQGGAIAAAVDNTIGPLSYLVAPPSVTTQLNLSFLRPVPPEMPHVEVEATFDERTRQHLFFSACVLDPEGRVLALAQATCAVVPTRSGR
jgi:uncharacterized protein (TIGR00369 family)